MLITDCVPCAQAKVRFYVRRVGGCPICGSAIFEQDTSLWIFRLQPRRFYSCDCGPGPVIDEAMRVDSENYGIIAWR